MIPRPLGEITGDDLEQLVADQVHEGRSLDYKRDLHLSKNEHKRELARDVSSFANAAGGDLVFGIRESKGHAIEVVGVDCDDFDATKLHIENIVRTNIAPRVQGIGIHKIDGFANGPVIIVRVPRSWNAPHMVTFSGSHFYSRTNSGKYPLDVREIGAAFLAGTEQAEKVRRFRDERLGKIVAGDTPMQVAVDEGAFVVLHALPVIPSGEFELDIGSLGKDQVRFPPPWRERGWGHRFNLDGFVTYSGPDRGPQYSYLQVFRSGAIEALELMLISTKTTPPRLWPLMIEASLLRTATLCVQRLREAGCVAPISVNATVLGAKGVRLHYGDWDLARDADNIIDRDPLILPDVLVADGEASMADAMRPMFDALWQSSGWERSYGYDKDGKWSADLHR